MEKLKDKVAIVTGGANGIGAATARMFVNEGARVIVCDLRDSGSCQQPGPGLHGA
jgi:NAD(P)-dependent dehydrogenase (short-subunit alcohol dehydrogenase family)